MKHIEFSNGFYAELSGPNAKGERVLRLYTPDRAPVVFIPATEENAATVGEAMMHGYFAGFGDCKRKIKSALYDAINHVSIVDVQR